MRPLDEPDPMAVIETPPGDEDLFPCPICGEELKQGVKKCRHCREWIERNCEECNTPLRGVFAARGVCAECATARYAPVVAAAPGALAPTRSKGTAIMLAALLGGVGVHRFYLNRPGSGLLYLLFCWTLIPTLLGLCEAFRLAVMDDGTFQAKYG